MGESGVTHWNEIFSALGVFFSSTSIFTRYSRIDVGQKINVEPGKFGKKNKRRALNNRRAWKIWQTL